MSTSIGSSGRQFALSPLRGLKTVLRLRIKAGIDLGETLTYPTFYNYLKNGVDSCIDIKMLQISGIIYKEIKGLPEGYDEKKLSKYQRYLYKITEIPMSSFLRLANQLKECDRWKEELDFISYNVMKEIDDEMVSKLKESVGEDLQINYPRGNAKSIMDCLRLTGKNPYAEQEEQKKMKVRK